jgi:gliding motility-associated-like protein
MVNGNYINEATIVAFENDSIISNNVSSVEPVPSDFFIPEGFSPNEDDINDLFVIRGILNFPSNDFRVFNRWGVQIYQAIPYTNAWDGKSTSNLNVGGDTLPVGTYFYVLDLKDGSEVYTGTIYLNR